MRTKPWAGLWGGLRVPPSAQLGALCCAFIALLLGGMSLLILPAHPSQTTLLLRLIAVPLGVYAGIVAGLWGLNFWGQVQKAVAGGVCRITGGRTVFVVPLALSLLIAASFLRFYGIEQRVSPDAIYGGYYYYFIVPDHDLALFERVARDGEDMHSSNLVLYENGQRLPFPHQYINDITTIGGGRYIHMDQNVGNVVIFSASDNSDPTVNGRSYEACYRVPLRMPIFFSIIFLSFVMLFAECWRSRFLRYCLHGATCIGDLFTASTAPSGWTKRHFISVGMAAVLANIIMVTYMFAGGGPVPCLGGDTLSYVTHDIIRPMGYPLFLDAVFYALKDLSWVVVLQLNIEIFSFIVLGFCLGAAIRQATVGALVSVVLILSLAMIYEASSVMAEALFIAFLCLHLAAVCHFLAYGKLPAVFIAALCAAIACAIRSAGISLYLGLPLLVLFGQGQRLRASFAALAGVLLIAAGSMLYNMAWFGSWSQPSFGPLNFLRFTVQFLRPDTPTDHPKLVRDLAARLAPVLEKGRQRPDSGFALGVLTRKAEQFANISDEASEILSALVDIDFSSAQAMGKFNALANHLIVRAVKEQPLGYASLVLSNFAYMWATAPIENARWYVDTVDRCIISNHAMYYEELKDHFRHLEEIQPERGDLRQERHHAFSQAIDRYLTPTPEAIKYFVAASAAISWIGLAALLAFPRLSSGWRALGYASLAVNANFAMISAVTLVIPRYSVSMYPVLMVILIAGATMISRLLIWPKREAARLPRTKREAGASQESVP